MLNCPFFKKPRWDFDNVVKNIDVTTNYVISEN